MFSIMAKVQGHWDPAFSKLPEIMQELINSGQEVGASLVVNLNGRTVLDIYGGYADAEKTRAWEENTITNVVSTTKIITALAALLLVDRKLLDPEAKVSQYWPEFGANGKQDILVRHILGHTSGVSGWDQRTTINDLCDLEATTAHLATQAPFWVPGTAGGYHVWTYGHLVGELIRRITGKSLKQFVTDELATPLNADFQIGAAEKDWPRVSNVIPPPPPPGPPPFGPDSFQFKSFLARAWTVSDIWTPEFKRAEIGATNGHSNARGVAKIISAVSNGGVVINEETGKQIRLLSPETIELIFKEQSNGIDMITGEYIRRGVGAALVGDGKTHVDAWMAPGKICYWGGLGGSMGIMDVGRGITVAYVMNKMEKMGLGNEAVKKYLKAIYEVVGVEVGPVKDGVVVSSPMTNESVTDAPITKGTFTNGYTWGSFREAIANISSLVSGFKWNHKAR